MKINLDDPNLTAFALGELSGAEFIAMEAALAQSPEAQLYVSETQRLARQLSQEFRAHLEEAKKKPANIMPLTTAASFWSDARWLSIGLAAVLAVCALVAAVTILGHRPPTSFVLGPRIPTTSLPATNDVEMEVIEENAEAAKPANSLGTHEENPFLPVAANRISTFPLEVGKASYENLRRSIVSSRRPSKAEIRIEELINNFGYEFRSPQPNESWALNLDLTPCPWQSAHRLARIGLKAEAAVEDAKVEVAFNPARVAAYRMIGFEPENSRPIAGEKMEPEKIAAGRTITVLYEIVPAATASNSEWLTVKLRHQVSGKGKIELLEHSLGDTTIEFAQAPADFRFAAAVAEFGMILRDSPHKGDGTLASVELWAENAKGNDTSGERAEFVELVKKAQALRL